MDFDIQNEIRLKELEILKYIDKFCKKNDINYSLAYGTLLGCVRHKGFIPWDDDIDIYMVKKDYDKFKKLYVNEQNHPYFLQNFETEMNTPFTFAKIRVDKTKFISKAHMKLKIHQGIFIDIFPLYKVPKESLKRRKHLRKIKFWRQIFISKSISRIDREIESCKDIFILMVRKLLHFLLIPMSKKYLFKKMEQTASCYEELDNNEAYFRPIDAISTEKISYDDIFPLLKMEFEGYYFSVPKNYGKILTDCYGDYMKLPPENKRISHRPVIIEIN